MSGAAINAGKFEDVKIVWYPIAVIHPAVEALILNILGEMTEYASSLMRCFGEKKWKNDESASGEMWVEVNLEKLVGECSPPAALGASNITSQRFHILLLNWNTCEDMLPNLEECNSWRPGENKGCEERKIWRRKKANISSTLWWTWNSLSEDLTAKLCSKTVQGKIC